MSLSILGARIALQHKLNSAEKYKRLLYKHLHPYSEIRNPNVETRNKFKILITETLADQNRWMNGFLF